MIQFLLIFFRKMGFNFMKTLSQRLGHDRMHVDGHKQGHDTEEHIDAYHGQLGQYMRKHL